MLTDVIAARPEEAEAVLSSRLRANTWPSLQSKSVDTVKLASLAFIIKGKPLDDDPVVQYMSSFRALADGGEDGPWIELIPEDLTLDLANLDAEHVLSVATKWAATEEARLDRWTDSGTQEYLAKLAAFAASARAAGCSLLLYIGL